MKPTQSKLPPIQAVPGKKGKNRRQSNRKGQDNRIRQQRIDEIINQKAIKYQREDSLKVAQIKGSKEVVETDHLFIDSIKTICHSRQNVLHELMGSKDNQLTEQECDQIHYRAKLHRRANMININTRLTKKDIQSQHALRSLFCKCGCNRFKGKSYPVCEDMQSLSFLGSGILLFFTLVKGLVFGTAIFLAYAFYAMITYSNGTLYATNSPSSCVGSYCNFKNRFSSYNEANPNQTFVILDWIGLGVSIIWIIICRLVKYYGFYQNEMIDKSLKSSSDFAIKIDNLPVAGYSQEQLYEFFEQQYQRKVKTINPNQIGRDVLQYANQNFQKSEHMVLAPAPVAENKVFDISSLLHNQQNSKIVEKLVQQNLQNMNDNQNHFNIRSIQIIYKMEFSRRIIDKITNKAQYINTLFKEYEGQIVVKNKDRYQEVKKQIIEVYETLEDLRKKFLNDSSFRQKIATHSAIIQFITQEDKTKVMEHLGHQNLTLYKRIKQNFIECIRGTSNAMFKGQIPDIIRAPEPSDILWANCEKQFSYLRIFMIYLAAFVVIMISLGIIAGVQTLQVNLNNNSAGPSTVTTVLNVIASVVLTLVNAILWVLLKFLLDYEYNHTITNKITSLMTKASFATWVNIILIPLTVNYLLFNKYYGSDGVTGMVFDYQVAALAASLPLMLFSPLQILINIAIKIRCIRNLIIRLKYRKKGEEGSKIEKDQMKKIIQFYEPSQFVIEQAYVFIMPNIMQAFFFCQLQPVLLVFAFAQTLIFYWVCKIRVLKLCKVPVLIDRLVFEVAIYQVMLAPIFYGVGSICNSYISSKQNPSINFSFLGAAICVGVGFLNYFNPGNIFQKFVDCIAECFPCLRKEFVYEHLVKLSDENEGGLVSIRIQNYYKNSNSLSLLGFQKTIMGHTKSEEIQKELQSFCESHVGVSLKLDKEEDNFILSDGTGDHDLERLEPKHVANIFQ